MNHVKCYLEDTEEECLIAYKMLNTQWQIKELRLYNRLLHSEVDREIIYTKFHLCQEMYFHGSPMCLMSWNTKYIRLIRIML